MESKTISIALALLAAIVTSSSAQFVIGRGACPDTGTVSGFDLSQYLGTWYEYERFRNFFELGMSCVSAEYGDNGDGSISVTNSGLRKLTIRGRNIFSRPNSIDGNATVPDPTKPAELKVSFSDADMGDNANYFIVDTDYTNYAVVFSCSELPRRAQQNVRGVNIQFAWILTRVRGQAPANLASIKANLDASGVNVRRFNLVDQSNCV